MSGLTSGGIRLYGYFRSSASWRVRIALGLKELSYDYQPVNLLKGEQRSDWYRAINPAGAVPTLVVDGHTISESLPIIEYLEETRPANPLLPKEPALRAKARQIAELVNAGIQPYQNLHVLVRVDKELGLGEHGRNAWAQHYIARGLAILEQVVAPVAGTCCVGDVPTVADVCLVPQLFGARRFKVDLTPYPTLVRIEQHLATLPAFAAAVPEKQPDCPPDQR